MHPDLAERYHAHSVGLLEQQAEWEHEELARMVEKRDPSLITALEILTAEASRDTLETLFIQRWLAGDALAYEIVPEDQVCDALRPYWETVRNDD